MSGLGIAHVSLATGALVLGALVVLRRKGDRLHRTLGHLYVGAMLGTNVTALCIYRLFGVFGPFHLAALLSLATTVAGLVPVVARWPRRTWYEYHARFMSWSYVGLVAAAVSEALVRIPSAPFAPAVLAATLGVTVLGAFLIHGRRSALVRRALQRAGVALIVCALPAVPLRAQSDAALAAADTGITRAAERRDVGALGAIRSRLAAMPADGRAGALATHYLAYAWYREASLLERGPRRDLALDSARALLERSLESLPLPESHAVLATVVGLQIDGSPWRGMRWGARIASSEQAARELGATNPRVALQAGIDAFYTPLTFGGGLDRAERELGSAIDRFANDRPAAGLPSWGRAEAWAWLGRVRAKRGDAQGARAAYAKALEIEPGYEWVKRVLLPALDVPTKR